MNVWVIISGIFSKIFLLLLFKNSATLMTKICLNNHLYNNVEFKYKNLLLEYPLGLMLLYFRIWYNRFTISQSKNCCLYLLTCKEKHAHKDRLLRTSDSPGRHNAPVHMRHFMSETIRVNFRNGILLRSSLMLCS